ncbi:uncharacterized protein LOC130821289 [Amaranthus tricolor]|uniref:uncharacterized protein LOC130821289 n=1 Tax=Amaranthus tricolor TaxID=29722 RepID=UPI00258D212E|nr:uncharacterized protein LOC130821289 [Amaranthus tricolor]
MKHHQIQTSKDHGHDLHSLNKNSTSKIVKLKSLSSLAPPSNASLQPKVYKVKPIHFRELVQKLTGAQSDHIQLLQKQSKPDQTRPKTSVAPPPLSLLHQPHQLKFHNQNENKQAQDNDMGTSEFIMSPNFQAWFSFAMLSPGRAAISQLE